LASIKLIGQQQTRSPAANSQASDEASGLQKKLSWSKTHVRNQNE
jgi:hypothetical protein